MFEVISGVNIPKDETKVWRYMDLAKLLSILETKTLFFPTVDLLRKMADAREGSLQNLEPSQYVGGTEKSKRDIWGGVVLPVMDKVARKQVAVSCWYVSDHESNAMWKSYLHSNEGIAIQTTFGKLKEAFDNQHPNWLEYGGNFVGQKIPIVAGQVEYVDWQSVLSNTKPMKQFFYKGVSFDHERELRLIAKLFPLVGSPDNLEKGQSFNVETINETHLGLSAKALEQVSRANGVSLPIILDKLITNIYVVPTAAKWFADLIHHIRTRYELSADVQWSDWMAKTPEY